MNVKRIFNLGMVMLMLVTSFAVSQPVAAEAPAKFTPRITPGAQTVPGEVVVAFADSQEKNLVEKIEQAVETANDAGGEVTRLSLDGSAVIQVDGDATAALAELNSQPDVLYAELNYVYSAPELEAASEEEYKATSDYVFRNVTPSAGTNWKSIMAVPRSTIEGMTAMGVYPNDTYNTVNQGWYNMGADIVWPNTTPSANICEIDTGVDYTHPDLSYTYSYRGKKKKIYYATAYRVLQGYDFVNADADPMDDNGHGTHVAGIMVALQNNSTGVSGVSTGNVVAVKALDAQGTGTNFDIAKAIKFCADRSDISVINLSLGGPAPSAAIESALLYATTPTTEIVPGNPPLPGCATTASCVYGKGKLVVAAAGNNNSQTVTYPAAYSIDTDFPNYRILSVGATGKLVSGDIDYACRANTSNYGNWVTVAAPGLDIYSTTPWDKPFYQNYYQHTSTRYDYQSGTSMAAAFVSASAARRMGYKPLETNEQVGRAIVAPQLLGLPYDSMDSTCTPTEMQAVKRLNVATLMDRAGIRVSVFDAAAGIPLNGASVAASYLNDGVTSYRYATLSTDGFKDIFSDELDPNRIFTYYISVTDILDVPTVSTLGSPISNYSLLVSKTGYTSGYQSVFQQDNLTNLAAGSFNVFTNGAVPPATADFNVVLGWHVWKQATFEEALPPNDLDLYVWLPDDLQNTDPGQPASFIVGYGGDSFGYVEGDPYGTMTDFPFARMKREGGFSDGGPTVETTSIAYRSAHGTVAANSNLPYYAGTYTILATDYGQTIDHDNDGCGDNYGYNFKTPLPNPPPPGYNPANYYIPGAECTSKTSGIPLLGAYFTPYAYVWKDGVVKYFQSAANNYGPWSAEVEPAENVNNCNDHWWKAFSIFTTTASSAPVYTGFDNGTPGVPFCDDGQTPNFIPYVGTPNNGERITLSGLGK